MIDIIISVPGFLSDFKNNWQMPRLEKKFFNGSFAIFEGKLSEILWTSETLVYTIWSSAGDII